MTERDNPSQIEDDLTGRVEGDGSRSRPDFLEQSVSLGWDQNARLIESFCERSETKDPMSGQIS
jgi:hypothetical protein